MKKMYSAPTFENIALDTASFLENSGEPEIFVEKGEGAARDRFGDAYGKSF